MEIYRIVKEAHAKTLHASGRANRWNKNGQHVIYAGSSRSLSTLEMVVNLSGIQPVAQYKVMIISINDDLIETIPLETIHKDVPNWRTQKGKSNLQIIGAEWYNEKSSLILEVPSAVIPQESNFIINTQHKEFTPENVDITNLEDYFWDERLF